MLLVDLRQNVVVTSVTIGLTTSASVLTARRGNAAKVTTMFNDSVQLTRGGLNYDNKALFSLPTPEDTACSSFNIVPMVMGTLWGRMGVEPILTVNNCYNVKILTD